MTITTRWTIAAVPSAVRCVVCAIRAPIILATRSEWHWPSWRRAMGADAEDTPRHPRNRPSHAAPRDGRRSASSPGVGSTRPWRGRGFHADLHPREEPGRTNACAVCNRTARDVEEGGRRGGLEGLATTAEGGLERRTGVARWPATNVPDLLHLPTGVVDDVVCPGNDVPPVPFRNKPSVVTVPRLERMVREFRGGNGPGCSHYFSGGRV